MVPTSNYNNTYMLLLLLTKLFHMITLHNGYKTIFHVMLYYVSQHFPVAHRKNSKVYCDIFAYRVKITPSIKVISFGFTQIVEVKLKHFTHLFHH